MIQQAHSYHIIFDMIKLDICIMIPSLTNIAQTSPATASRDIKELLHLGCIKQVEGTVNAIRNCGFSLSLLVELKHHFLNLLT